MQKQHNATLQPSESTLLLIESMYLKLTGLFENFVSNDRHHVNENESQNCDLKQRSLDRLDQGLDQNLRRRKNNTVANKIFALIQVEEKLSDIPNYTVTYKTL